MRVIRACLVLFALIASSAGAAQAQSLGELARAEAARRKAVKSAGKVYTNDNLRPEPESAVPPPVQASAPVSPAPTSPGPASDAADAAASAPETPDGKAAPRDQAYWRTRIEAERAALERSRTLMDAVQSRINALTTDFVNRDDPQQRAGIAADRQKALAEQARLTKEIQQHEKAIQGIQDEARRAGVPAGWVR